MSKSYKLFDFNVYNAEGEKDDDDECEESKKDNKVFMIQMFGINEKGDIASIFVEDFKPFFYIKVDDSWSNSTKFTFLSHMKEKVGKYYENSIVECKLIKRKKLYGFDGGKEHKFILLKFNNTSAMNKAKNLWFEYRHTKDGKSRRLMKQGYNFNRTATYLYEANIPPLLRYFHIKELSPSGWIAIPTKKARQTTFKSTHCTYEYNINYKHIIPLGNKETPVPYKICSFDIEASSSHGDFPLPVKSYKKLATNIIEIWDKRDTHDGTDKELLYSIINTAFEYDNYENVDKIYAKNHPSVEEVAKMFNRWIKMPMNDFNKSNNDDENTIEKMFEDLQNDDDSVYEFGSAPLKTYTKKKATIIDLLNDKIFDRESKLHELNKTLNMIFPRMEGDKVTFIGSTFLKYGEDYPYLNHCIALDTCSDLTEVPNSELESYDTEKEVLLAWAELIQREDPDIIIGYNIFGFDYEFMFRRALENNCEQDFLKLSRNKDEICGNVDYKTGRINIENNSIIIASGEFDLKFIKMSGRLQVDLYNYFRRDYSLTSYKLDYVSGYFIGDNVKKLSHNEDTTKIYSKNLTGLENGNFIHFEETSHSTDVYKDGQKFKVLNVNYDEGTFEIDGIENPDMTKQVRWGLAKDDVTPQDIFRLTNEGPNERAIIAKYCIQDCNLVHHLMRKIDVITGYIEMSKICSVPMNFLVMRGQGIKLTSYVAKKCREKRTLMPLMEKSFSDDSYEGAIVLPPKTNLYLDNPVACVDYSSLYPSSMISDNLSHDSKVWTKEYDLNDELVDETGETDKHDNYIYDNLPEYDYVNVTYDAYKWIPNQRGKVEKVITGKKICRFAQFKEGKAIMPSILEELLTYRKTTRVSAKYKKITTNENSYIGIIDKQEGFVNIKDKAGVVHKIKEDDIIETEDAYDDFMKNILDKRQLAAKITANSLYGQCGAKTSTFYEVDVAASCTAIGRNLLTYAKRVIEEAYGDTIVSTKKYGKVRTRAEYIYGDTDSVFFTFNVEDLDGNKIRGKPALEITIDLAKEAGALATKFLKNPHDLEYEKTFMPFCLLSKKRYVGMLYENDPDKCKRKSMGIVLKRRDNAPIVKDVYGGIIDILMKEQNVEKAIEFLEQCLQNVIDEKYPLEKLIVTKSLRSGYKNPQTIAHKVLADRIGKRDPGNKPSPGDRIPYVYIQTKKKVRLQGNRIEHPDYIIENDLKLDYSFYISNQIMKPVQQVFALVLEDIESFQKKKKTFLIMLDNLRYTFDDDEKYRKKVDDLRNKEVKALLFDKYLRQTDNMSKGQHSIMSFF